VNGNHGAHNKLKPKQEEAEEATKTVKRIIKRDSRSNPKPFQSLILALP
jgi:hypothetical protein